MIVDILVTVILFFGVLGGWLRGMLYQLGQVAVLLVAFLAGRSLGGGVAEIVADWGILASTSALIGFSVIFMLVMTVGGWILWRFTKMMRQSSSSLSQADRVFGVLLGGAKALLLCYILIVALIMIHRRSGSLPVNYATSVSGRWVVQNNFLDGDAFPRAKALVKLGIVMGSKDSIELATNPHFQAIILHPKAAPLRTPAVVKALIAKDWLFLVEQEAFWDLLDEPEIQEHLNAIEEDPPPAEAPRPLYAPDSRTDSVAPAGAIPKPTMKAP